VLGVVAAVQVAREVAVDKHGVKTLVLRMAVSKKLGPGRTSTSTLEVKRR